jgi:protein phosphatase 2C
MLLTCFRTNTAAAQERIEQAGGMLLNNGGLRLMGMLATTRAIGDHDLQPYGLTPVPEVMRLPRSSDDEFLVGAGVGPMK